MTQEDGPFPHGCVLVDDYFSSPDQHRDVAIISCHPLLLSSHELHALGSTLLSITLCGQCRVMGRRFMAIHCICKLIRKTSGVDE